MALLSALEQIFDRQGWLKTTGVAAAAALQTYLDSR
jgi:hypothetical protein